MPVGLDANIEAALGQAPLSTLPLCGGCVSKVYRLAMPDGSEVVAKLGGTESGLGLEGWMLRYLRKNSNLPVPTVLHESDELLVTEYIPNEGGIDRSAQINAADLLAALHDVTTSTYGLERDTLIGGLHQPNPQSTEWLPFFCNHRLLHMGRQSLAASRMPKSLMTRLESFCARLGEFLEEPAAPSLIHGDMWTGNILCTSGRIAGFVDPAIYYADPEIELAFSTLFGTFGDPFFSRYQEHRPLKPGFAEARRDIYNLYPLLVHVRLFGGSYVGSVSATLSRFGG